MNSVHDMGGMQGFGPIQPEENEPVFHARWEGRILAMRRILGAIGKIRGNTLRPSIESISPAEYLSNSYYENWYTALVKHLTESGLATPEEIVSGKAASDPLPVTTLNPEQAAVLPFRSECSTLQAERAQRFHVGQHVRARNLNPVGHTRLPRYVRGRIGVIEQERDVQALPDTFVYGLGAHPQRVYLVRFAARELWGEQASPHDSVYLDLWDDYLDAA